MKNAELLYVIMDTVMAGSGKAEWVSDILLPALVAQHVLEAILMRGHENLILAIRQEAEPVERY